MDFEKYTERARGFIQSAQALALRVLADRLEHGEAKVDLGPITFAAA